MKLFVLHNLYLNLLWLKCLFYFFVHVFSRLDGDYENVKPSNLTNYRKNLMRHDSSKVAVSNIIFKGDFMAFDKSIPGLPAAQFRFQLLYKGGFGGAGKRPKYIWVICKSRYQEFNCLLSLNKRLDYVVYLNGSFVKMANLTGSKRKLFWLTTQPQRATNDRLDEVEKYSCLDCSQKPRVKLKLDEPLIENKWNKTLKCYLASECKLVSYIFWYKNNKLIKDKTNKNYIINNYRHTSLLTLINYTRRPNEDDRFHRHDGLYKCIVVNVLGWKYSHSLELPSGNITNCTKSNATIMPSIKGKNKFKRCNDDDPCHNRGDCWLYPDAVRFYCKCHKGYIGQTCEMKESVISKELYQGSVEFSLFLFFGVFIVLLIIIAIFFIIYCFRRLRQDIREQINSVVATTNTDKDGSPTINRNIKNNKNIDDVDHIKVGSCYEDEESYNRASHSINSTLIKIGPPSDEVDEYKSTAYKKPISEDVDIATDQNSTFKSSPQRNLDPPITQRKYINLKSTANGHTKDFKFEKQSATLPASSFTHYIIGTPKTTPRMTK